MLKSEDYDVKHQKGWDENYEKNGFVATLVSSQPPASIEP